MILYPALDLLDGKVVRLVQGDFAQQTIFSDDPAQLFRQLANEGARYLHLVDLSGARDPKRRQKDLLKSLLKQAPYKVQLGGGIRQIDEIRELLDLGVERVVLGSLIVTDPQTAYAALEQFGPERLTFALDIQLNAGQPIVMSHGWSQSSGLTFRQVIEPFAARGLRRVLCTDIAVDGRMVGPNLDLYRSLRREFPELELQASGGVEKLDDLKALSEVGVHSVVVGRALLSGAFTLTEALAYAE